MINFLKSLILPTRMNKYRHMSIFIAVFIFLFGSFIIIIPESTIIDRNRYELMESENVYSLTALIDIPNTEGAALLTLKDYGCRLDDNKEFVCTNESVIPQGEPLIITYNTTIELADGTTKDITRNIYFVIDFYDYKNNAERYFDVEKDFDELVVAENHENYLVVFYKNAILYKIPPVLDDNGVPLGQNGIVVETKNITFTFEDFGATASTAGYYTASKLMDGFIPIIKNQLSFNALIYGVFYSLLIVFMVWLISKRNGRLKTFKEYYNIAGISSVAPLLLVFALAWFIPGVSQFYSFAFALFYLFIIFKLNNMPEIV